MGVEIVQLSREQYEALVAKNNQLVIENNRLRKIEEEYIRLKETTSTDSITLSQQYQQLQQEYRRLQEQYRTLKRMVFGRKREKVKEEDSEQLQLFNEAEAIADEEKREKVITVRSHRRKKGGKKRLPDTLPVEIVEYEGDEKQKICPCCGKARPVIGEERSEELDVIPAKVQKRVIVRKKYGPCSCDAFLEEGHKEVETAAGPKRLLPGSQVSERTIAYVIVSKYMDGMPLHRQEGMLNRYGIEITKGALSNMTLQVASRCQPIYRLMVQEAKRGPLIQMDETTVQVLHQEGRSPTSKSYMWVMVGYPEKDKPVIVYHYAPGRGKDVPLKLLEGYSGYLQCDGYDGYDAAIAEYCLKAVGCFSHARRKFYEVYEVSKDEKPLKAIRIIDELFRIEDELRKAGYDDDTFVAKRKEATEPVLHALYEYCSREIVYALPTSKYGEALAYCIRQWNRLITYREHAWCRPDNNFIERIIRHFVVGRKNWLFANTVSGAWASALLYSLLQTAKENNIEPYQYLCTLFSLLPYAQSVDDLYSLLPHRIVL